MRASDLVGRILPSEFRGQAGFSEEVTYAETQRTNRSQSCENLKAMCVQEKNEQMLKHRGERSVVFFRARKVRGAGARGR